MIRSINNYQYVMQKLKKAYAASDAPSVTLIANTKKDPFYVLLSTLISLRTKDQVTLTASKRLFEKVNSFNDLKISTCAEIEKLIYPAGFYKTKAVRMKEIADIVLDRLNGKIPDTLEGLMELPGVGRKTANLVLILGFKKPGLCVDTHVHRITNRFGWVKTKTPDETEFALRDSLPVKYWKIINDYLVSYGQIICKPVSPLCSSCTLNDVCPKVNVVKSR